MYEEVTWLNFIGNRYEVVNSDDVLEINKIYKARDVFTGKCVNKSYKAQ